MGEEKSKWKHVVPLNTVIDPNRKILPLSACDCDNYTCTCDHGTDICGVGDTVCAAENVDVDACGVWG